MSHFMLLSHTDTILNLKLDGHSHETMSWSLKLMLLSTSTVSSHPETITAGITVLTSHTEMNIYSWLF